VKEVDFMTAISNEDVKHLVAIAGREGAICALEGSRQISTQDLTSMANSLGLKIKSKDSKRTIATEIVRHLDRRITKTLDELKTMSKDEIIQYFEQVGCDQDELVDLLKGIDLRSRARSRRAMLEFAAIQISSLGIFERLTDRHD